MPYPSLTFAHLLENATRAELEQFVSLLQGYLSEQHTDTGAHGAITSTSLTSTGAGVFDGNVTADADGSPVIAGEHSAFSGAVNVGVNGVDMRTMQGATLRSRWRVGAAVNTLGARELFFQDLVGAVEPYTFRVYWDAGNSTYAIEPGVLSAMRIGTNLSGRRVELGAGLVTAQTINAPINGFQVASAQVVANAGTYDFPGGAAARGFLFITAEEDNATAIFQMRAGTGTTTEVSDPIGLFSAAVGTATSTNVYWNAGTSTYRVQNNRGGSRTYELVIIGTGII